MMYCQEGDTACLEGSPESVRELHGDGTQDPAFRVSTSPGLVTKWGTEQPSYHRLTFISFLNSKESYWEPSFK